MTAATIIGFGHSMPRPLALDDEHGIVIGINNSHAAHKYQPDYIVAMDDLERDLVDYPDYVKAIVEAGCPVFTTQDFPQWPTTRAYPIDRARGFLGDTIAAEKILTNTCNYALAWAMLEGYNPINLVGLDWYEPDKRSNIIRARTMLKKTDPDWIRYYREPLIRKPTEPGVDGCCFLIGFGIAQGYRININPGSTLLDHDRDNFFYGYN